MKISIIIPAKGTSERLTNKNMLEINSKSLVYRACEKCLNSSLIDNVYLDTESEIMINSVSELVDKGLKVIKRPDHLASNKFGGNELIVFEQSQIEKSDLILHTYPTSPLITTETIDKTIQFFIDNGQEYDSFFTGIHFQEYIWDENGPINFNLDELPNAVNLPKNIVVETHGLYGIRDGALSKYKRRLGNKCLPIKIPREQAMDINYEEDFKLLEMIWTE